jgi:hypothetical protein
MSIFWVCVVVRLFYFAFAFLQHKVTVYSSFFIGIFFLILATNLVKRDTGIESSAPNNEIWWKELRWVHSTLFLSYSFLQYNFPSANNSFILLFDVCFGGAFYLKFK